MSIGQTGCGKTHLVLELIKNHYKNHFLIKYLLYVQPSEKIIKHIMLESGSKMMTKFGL